jgi:sugar lactone lactonase YvrE
MNLRVAVEANDQLGEGPCWSAVDARLYWFDIRQRRLHWLEADGAHEEIPLPFCASAAAARQGGGLLMATEDGLATFDAKSADIELVRPMTFEPGFRTNDGKVDPYGRFWWSTMDDDGGRRPGAVHVTNGDLATRAVVTGVHIANAMAFSSDGRTFFLADSRLKTLFACDSIDPGVRRVFARTSGDVAPDGAAMDADGRLWNAHWGAGRLVRYQPDGRIDQVVELPVTQPTSCAFGGHDVATLYVTSACEGLTDIERERQPLAGALFALDPDTPGLPLPLFKG